MPELNLPPAEHLHFPNLTGNSGGSATVRLDAKAWNQTMSGLMDGNVREVTLDLENVTCLLALKYSYVRWQGDYKFFGKVMLFEIDANGTFDINVSK